MTAMARPPDGSPWKMSRVAAWNLSRLRRERGWSQHALGMRLVDFVGRTSTQAQISALEKQRCHLGIDMLAVFAELFAVPLGEFLTPPPGVTPPPCLATGNNEAAALKFCSDEALIAEVARRVRCPRQVTTR